MAEKTSLVKLLAQLAVVGLLVWNIFIVYGLGQAPAAASSANKLKWTLITVADSTCSVCRGLEPILDFIEESQDRVEIVARQTVDYDLNKEAANSLIDQYQLTKLPALIIKGTKPLDGDLLEFWQRLGSESDGDFVLNKIQPPYRDLVSGQVRGMFKVSFLSDASCKNCYDVKLHQNAFRNISMAVTDSEDIDVASPAGKDLVKKYKIGLVPTIVVSGQLDEYEGFQAIWPSVGTREVDGVYVLRQGVESMGIYKDMKTGKVIDSGVSTSGGSVTGGNAAGGSVE